MSAVSGVLKRAAGGGRLGWGLAIGAVLLLALGLRVWGVHHGLPYAYNADENAHFVTRSIGLFEHNWNPGYFVNPPAYTYASHVLLAVWYGGREAVSSTFAMDPTEVWVITRVLAGVLGTIAVWLAYLAGARLFDRRTGLLAAGIYAVAFLPVFYSKLALNDVPTLLGVGIGLWGAAGILRKGRVRDYLIAGAGLGIACATKYTGGIVLLPIIAAAATQFLAAGGRSGAIRGITIAGVVAIALFLILNPYSIKDTQAFWDGLTHQSDATGDAAGKLGLTQDNGILYYLWSFGWGLGWIPLLAAAFGAVRLWFADRRLVFMLALPALLFLLFMGTQGRYFGRWLMPVFPFVCILAAYGALELAALAGRVLPALRPTFVALAVVALCVQGFVYSVHSGLVTSRADTRNMTRDWMVAHVPERSKIVVEPVVPDAWAQDIGHPSPATGNGNRWVKFITSKSTFDPRTQEPFPNGGSGIVNIEDYEKILRPALIDSYEAGGYCWVVTGSTQRGRADADPKQVPNAIAYYKELARRGTVVYHASPYSKGDGPVKFNFDWTFDYYPLAYHRPGPEMTVYRLHGGQCAPTAPA